MTNTSKWIVGSAGLVLLVLVAAYGASRYLVSRLDGTGGVHSPTQQLERYSSEDGIMFEYPATYKLSSRTEGNTERQWDVLVLLPAGYEEVPYTEGPPALSMSVFQNVEALSLEAWVRGDARSNVKLSDGAITPGSIGGEPALFYRHTGLYETDTAVVAHKGKIFLFEAGWLNQDDAIRSDFQNLLRTVQFTS